MRDEQKRQKVTTIGFSLVSKLNIQLWLRLLSLFLVLNVVFCAAAILGTLYYAEQVLAEAHRAGPAVLGREISGITVNQLTGQRQGWTVPGSLQRFLPKDTATGTRFVTWNASPELSWWETLETFRYHLHLQEQGLAYTFSLGCPPVAVTPAVILGLAVCLDDRSSLGRVIRGHSSHISELAEKAGPRPGPDAISPR